MCELAGSSASLEGSCSMKIVARRGIELLTPESTLAALNRGTRQSC